MQKKYLISNDLEQRKIFIKSRVEDNSICIYNDEIDFKLKDEFKVSYSLKELYDDPTFLKALSKINSDTKLFVFDLGLKYCSEKADYIKPYLKINPLSEQAKDVYIIDYFAFYKTEKSIYRPFLYLTENPFNETLQQFYGTGAFKDYTGNQVEEYAKRIKPYINVKTEKIKINTIAYSPTEKEKEEYEELKKEVIQEKKYPKVKVFRILSEYINQTKTRMDAVVNCRKKGFIAEEVKPKSIDKIYKSIISDGKSEITFFDSGEFGLEKKLLDKIKTPIERHNKLIEVLYE